MRFKCVMQLRMTCPLCLSSVVFLDMKLQIASDLHLELGNSVVLEPVAPYLVLAGDIGDPSTLVYEHFLLTQADQFEKVFVVLGNHEYYHMRSMKHTKDLVRKICAKRPGKLVLMDCTRVDVEHVTVLGCTLWTHIRPTQQRDCLRAISDFRCIKEWSPAAWNETHAREAAWLRDRVTESTESTRPVIILTHHAPLENTCSDPRHLGDPVSSAYGTDGLCDLLTSPVNLWVHGHTHYSHDTTLASGTRILANQYGRPGECTNQGFDARKCVHV